METLQLFDWYVNDSENKFNRLPKSEKQYLIQDGEYWLHRFDALTNEQKQILMLRMIDDARHSRIIGNSNVARFQRNDNV